MDNLFQLCDAVIKELSKFSDDMLYLGPGIKDNRLELFETEIGFSLPADFKYIIKFHNGLSLNGIEVNRLDKELRGASLDELYKYEHYASGNPMPLEYLPFSADGFGNHYCFDLTKRTDGSCPVVFWQHDLFYENRAKVEVCNGSFVSWIQEVMIDWTLEDHNYDGTEK